MATPNPSSFVGCPMSQTSPFLWRNSPKSLLRFPMYSEGCGLGEPLWAGEYAINQTGLFVRHIHSTGRLPYKLTLQAPGGLQRFPSPGTPKLALLILIDTDSCDETRGHMRACFMTFIYIPCTCSDLSCDLIPFWDPWPLDNTNTIQQIHNHPWSPSPRGQKEGLPNPVSLQNSGSLAKVKCHFFGISMTRTLLGWQEGSIQRCYQ